MQKAHKKSEANQVIFLVLKFEVKSTLSFEISRLM